MCVNPRRVLIRYVACEQSCAFVMSLSTTTQSMPAAIAEFSPLDESSTTRISSLVAPKRFNPVRYGSVRGNRPREHSVTTRAERTALGAR